MPRTVEVPEGCKVVIVSEQLLGLYGDWVTIAAPDERYAVQAKAVPTDNPLVADVQTRFVEAESGPE